MHGDRASPAKRRSPIAAARCFLPRRGLLVVSDLHLEKGSSFARRGMLIPPYDSAATLALLAAVDRRVRSGRSSSASATAFTTATAPSGCIRRSAPHLEALMAGRDWFWIAGNHDPDMPANLPGETVRELGSRRAAVPPRAVARRCARRDRRASASLRAHRPARPLGAPPLLCHRRQPPDHAGLRRLHRLAQRARPRLCRAVQARRR